MTTTVSLAAAETSLRELIQRARQGDEIVIIEDGVLLARLVSISTPEEPRIAGLSSGAVTMADDFDNPLPDSF